jgi:cation diffusion facilitator CzcD-associated flavoprotein CzcO
VSSPGGERHVQQHRRCSWATPRCTTTDVLIIGSGFSGIGMAINLRRSGREDFVIIDKADEVGGTWRENTYPGCACDVPSHMYSFSYALNPDWTRSYSQQPEIWDYLRRVADDFELRPKIHFGTEMTSARWDESDQVWRVSTAQGATYTARVLVSGIGGLHIPHIPDLPGQDEFEGVAFHSARWRHDVDLTGKRVAVLGTGASAIQFVPEIARQGRAGHRLPAHGTVGPAQGGRAHPERTRAVFRTVPGAQRAYRNALTGRSRRARWCSTAIPRWSARRADGVETSRAERDDPRCAAAGSRLPLGCKRVTLSNDYYPTFHRDNVTWSRAPSSASPPPASSAPTGSSGTSTW